MKISEILKKVTGLFALIFMVNCSQLMRTANQTDTASSSSQKNTISTSFMNTCNPNNDASMRSICSCAESKLREEDAGIDNAVDVQGNSMRNSDSSSMRGITMSDIDMAVSDCRK